MRFEQYERGTVHRGGVCGKSKSPREEGGDRRKVTSGVTSCVKSRLFGESHRPEPDKGRIGEPKWRRVVSFEKLGICV